MQILDCYQSIQDYLCNKDINSNIEKFDEFLTQEELNFGLRNGEIVRGKIHFDYNWQEAFIYFDKFSQNEENSEKSKILILGKNNINRVINGDEVYVKILPRNLWRRSASESIVNEEGENIDEEIDYVSNVKDDISNSEKDDFAPNGKVVGVFKRNWRTYVATFQIEEETDKFRESNEILLCVPFDPKIPKIRVRTRNGNKYKNSRLKVVIDNWDVDSFYPNGHLLGELGKIGDLETETKVVLLENGLEIGDFGKMENCLPNDWTIPNEEIEKREDLRKSRTVLSIDPIGCEDIDDALSVHQISENVYEIGVHIADVTYFVPKNSPIDNEARYRGTSVYLKDRRIDMIPKRLSANECSLHKNKDRLVVSVFWKIDLKKKTKILEKWFRRSIVRSSAALSYVEANLMLLHPNKHDFDVMVSKQNEKQKEILEKTKSFDETKYKKLRKAILTLSEFAIFLRMERENNGAVNFNKNWELNSEDFFLDNVKDKEINELVKNMKIDKSEKLMNAHNVIEELMVLANHSVAVQILQSSPKEALLRRHGSPEKKSSKEMNEKLAKIGVEKLNFRTNKSLAHSVVQVTALKPKLDGIIKLFLRVAMSEAEYFCAGDEKCSEISHFGLAIDCYTHFTSPIRRYSDIVVHRNLIESAGFDINSSFRESPSKKIKPNQNSIEEIGTKIEQIKEMAFHLNTKNRSARNAQRMSIEFSRILELKNHFYYTFAVIIGIKENGFKVFVPNFQIEIDENSEDDQDSSSFQGAVVLKNKEGKFNEPFPIKQSRKTVENQNDCYIEKIDDTQILLKVPSCFCIKCRSKNREKI
ncbi:DIS3 mitotic control, variant 3 [Bonamia ostreae]|uniref:DIS3-like exonuclease 1 n=1 Tax=Bonamia ostreae TaxID=126728 RepID=A0ABV2AGI1_9EUKA